MLYFKMKVGGRRYWSYVSYFIVKGLCKGGSIEYS